MSSAQAFPRGLSEDQILSCQSWSSNRSGTIYLPEREKRQQLGLVYAIDAPTAQHRESEWKILLSVSPWEGRELIHASSTQTSLELPKELASILPILELLQFCLSLVCWGRMEMVAWASRYHISLPHSSAQSDKTKTNGNNLPTSSWGGKMLPLRIPGPAYWWRSFPVQGQSAKSQKGACIV